MSRALLALASLLLQGCIATLSSSEPLYPTDWPALEPAGEHGAVDLTGTWRAISEPAGPLVYPAGGQPREALLLIPFLPIPIPFGSQIPVPQLGRRILPWHLTGVMAEPDEPLRQGLERFSAAIGADADGAGWVRVQPGPGERLEVRCSVGDEVILAFELEPDRDRSAWNQLWTLPKGYSLQDGGLVVHSAFPLPAIERSPAAAAEGRNASAGGAFRFQRAVDGSLVMLESLQSADGGQEIVFRKWWRWLPAP